MKPITLRTFLRWHILLAATALSSLAQAATFTWTNTAGGSWADQGNWSGGTLPTTTSDTADFSTLNITAATTVSLNANQSINKLLFADATTASHDWTVAAGTPSTSTLTLGGSAPEISVSNRTATISAVLAGSDNWTKTGAGTLVLGNSSNSFSGGLTIQSGIVNARRSVSNLPLGASNNTVTINSTGNLTTGGQLQLNANGFATNAVTQSFVIQGTGESPGNTNAAIILQAGGGSNVLNISGSITLDGTGTYRIRTFGSGAGNLNNTSSINGGITRSGSNTGTLILEAFDFYNYANAFGSTTIVNSVIQNNGGPVTVVGNDNSILILQASGNSIGAFTINYNNKDKNVVKLGIDDALATNQNLTLTRGAFDLAGFDQTVNALSGVLNNSLITNSGTVDSTLTVGNGNGAATFSGVIQDGATNKTGLTKTGSGTQTLASANTYTGPTIVNAGTLALGASGSLASAEIELNGGQFDVSAVTGGYTLGAGQQLTGVGTVNGAVGVAGTLATGDALSTLTFANDLTLNPGSISNFGIDGFSPGTFDLVKAEAAGSQAVTFAGGTLNLLFEAGFNTQGSVKIFDFDSYAGSGFSTVSASGLAAGYTAAFDASTGFVTVVPEPAVLPLAVAAAGLAGVAWRRRRFSSSVAR
jgi:autotransporter-associated beta strand protein